MSSWIRIFLIWTDSSPCWTSSRSRSSRDRVGRASRISPMSGRTWSACGMTCGRSGTSSGLEPTRSPPLPQGDAELPTRRPGPHDQRPGHARCVSRNHGEPDGSPGDPRVEPVQRGDQSPHGHLHDHPADRHRLERIRDERRVLRLQRGGRPLSRAAVDGSPDRNPRMVDASKRVAVTGSSDESYRESSRTAWNATAEKYIKLLRVFEPYGFDLLARLSPKIRESALDLATGPGEPAMSIARMVGPAGRVGGIDLSAQMVRLATRIAKERRIPGVTFLAMDAEKLEFPDESFDIVASRFGFQVFANPETVA